MKDNGHRLQVTMFGLIIKKHFLNMKVSQPWNWRREVVATPSLEVSKAWTCRAMVGLIVSSPCLYSDCNQKWYRTTGPLEGSVWTLWSLWRAQELLLRKTELRTEVLLLGEKALLLGTGTFKNFSFHLYTLARFGGFIITWWLCLIAAQSSCWYCTALSIYTQG